MAPLSAPAAQRSLPWQGFIDCDVHNGIPGPEALAGRLPGKWRRQWEDYGLRYVNRAAYCPGPRRGAIRADAWPQSGKPAGSDLGFMREQLLDLWQPSIAVLNPIEQVSFGDQSPAYHDALARALNEWTAEEWLDREPRFRAAICVAYEDGELAAAEIER